MNSLQTQDGHFFIKSLSQFIRQHEKALANSLQLSLNQRKTVRNGTVPQTPVSPSTPSTVPSQSHSSLLSAFAHAGLNLAAYTVKSAHLTLTPHHLFYLLSQIEDLGIDVGPMNVRIESLHNESVQSNYVSFLQTPKASHKGRGDADSLHSVSSIRSVASMMSGFWSSLGLGSENTKSEKARAAAEIDLKYLYSAFTKLPSLRLTADHRAQLINGYEEFPFDTAVPLFAFKNLQQLDIIDMDFRQFHGWDRMADQLTLLTVKRGNVEELEDLLTNIVLDDAEKRRRRSNRNISEAPSTPSWTVPSTPPTPHQIYSRVILNTDSPPELTSAEPSTFKESMHGTTDTSDKSHSVVTSTSEYSSPRRPGSARPVSSYRHARSYSYKITRSSSGSSNSSDYSATPQRIESISNLASGYHLPASKWQRLKYLSLADNALTSITTRGVAPLATSLRSLNLSSNLFVEIPDSLAILSRLTSLDLSNCMIDSLQSLSRSPLPAITTLKLKSNRLQSLAGIERLVSLENLHVQDNKLLDPMEVARLTGMPNMRRLWIKQNPLTKTYRHYRVTIFNLFRKTPGYVEDLIIDDSGPSYAERKLLIPRAPELEVSIPRTSAPSMEVPVVVQHGQPRPMQPLAHAITDPVQESNSTTSRRRKISRRRAFETPANDDDDDVEMAGDRLPSVRTRLTINTAVHQIENSKQGSASPILVGTPLKDLNEPDPQPIDLLQSKTNTESHNHEYRERIEALRREFGSNWLSALGTQKTFVDSRRIHESSTASFTMHQVVKPLVTTGNRSLG